MANPSITKALQSLYKRNDSARAFFDKAAERKNDVAETAITIVCQMASVEKFEAIKLCRELEEAGCGELIVGRKGGRTRFRWAYSLPALGKVARGGEQTLEMSADVKADLASLTAGSEESAGLTIPEAKRLLAKSLDVSPDKIEIIVRA